MKKILLPFEGGHYPQELLDLAGMLQPMAPLMLTAAFVPESDYAGLVDARALPAPGPVSCYGDEDQMIRYNSQRLEQFCGELGIKLQIHLGREDFALPCLRKESRYADLMLLSGRHFFEDLDKEQPNAWMKDILHHSECPVLLFPDKTSLPEVLILSYDGSAASVFAIRQFAYLFPEFCRVRATLVYMNDDPEATMPEEESMRELCALHFKKLRVLKLRMQPVEFYHTWVGMMTNPWLVTGSFSKELISQHRVPVFVAHR
jgi:hypothetical protein